MAEFQITETEGMRWVKIHLESDSVRTEHRALHHMVGAVSMDVPLPSLRALWVSLFSEESLIRPRFSGTGEVFLDSSLGGFHVFEIREGERWVLDNRCFWAADAGINLGIYREWMITSFWAGEGLLWFKTSLQGAGKAVLSVDGPVQEIELRNDRLVVDGPFVLARTNGIKFAMRRPARSLLSYWMSGEKLARVYEGTGRLLMCTTPYWRLKLSRQREHDPSLME
jgi:uncharacterized protein (AIM24 family)